MSIKSFESVDDFSWFLSSFTRSNFLRFWLVSDSKKFIVYVPEYKFFVFTIQPWKVDDLRMRDIGFSSTSLCDGLKKLFKNQNIFQIDDIIYKIETDKEKLAFIPV